MSLLIIKTVLLLSFLNLCYCWDSEELEVFDVVDEVKENFYALLNISQDASNQQIKTAFRSLSLKLHPDKNQEVDTSEQFRNLVSVYEVLRSSTKRKYYNDILVNGLPNWRSAVYYYRYVRKMGITEVCVILFIIITIGQYLVNWGAYLEMKYTIEQNKKRKSKKSDRERLEAIVLPKPSVFNTLPIQIPRFMWHLIVTLPETLGLIKEAVIQNIENVQQQKQQVVEEVVEVPRVKTLRKRNKGFVLPEGPNFETTSNVKSSADYNVNTPQLVSGGLWTDDDLRELIKLIKKYPGGASGRWELIGEALGRSVAEVTYMAHKVKENGYRLPSEQEEETLEQPKIKQKTKKELGSDDSVKNWTQHQQKALEDALAKYPKGCTDRWDRISEHVSNKTKDECMARFRFLAELLKKQKEGTEQSED